MTLQKENSKTGLNLKAGLHTTATPQKKRVKTPSVFQMEAAECGAAAVAIVLGYYGRYVSLEELRLACGVSRDGSKASNLVKASRKYGFEVKAYRGEPEALRELPLPQIIHWNFNHFVVLEGFGKNRVYINDPAAGQRVVTTEEFDGSFTGISLLLTPSATFIRAGQPYNTLKALGKRLQGTRSALVFVVLISLALVLPGLVTPSFARSFVDDYLLRGQKDWLPLLLLAMLFTIVIQGSLVWLKEYYLLRLETKMALEMSSKFFWHVLRLPMQYYFQRYAGEIGQRVALNDQIAYLLSGKLASTLLDILMIAFFAILMFLYDPFLTGVVVFFALVNIVVLRYISRKRKDLNQKLLQERGRLNGSLMGGLQNIEMIKAGGTESEFFSRLAGQQAIVGIAEQKLSLYSQVLLAISPLLTALSTSIILTLGGWRIIEGQLTLGTLVAFQTLMFSFIGPINKLLELGSILQEVEGSLKRLDDVLVSPIEESPVVEEITDPRLNGQLELRNITFGYSLLEPPLIKDLNLTLKPGSRVALVGASGSGKSTVAKLVTGLFTPWSGEVLFDGKERNQIPRAVMINSLAVVDQDISLFRGTLSENLTLWNPQIPYNQLIKAAKDACIHEEISARPSGYLGRVEEDGRNFSGGQRQRLELARALVSNPSLVVLDEATAALDPITEKNIYDRLRRRGCTCLIIAHRLSTIRDCDEIIVLEQGQIVQRGTHEEMKLVDGPYARLIKE